ncbi:hypothetical protein ACA910_010094 [Epithemia clementina (nom. ined.)]
MTKHSFAFFKIRTSSMAWLAMMLLMSLVSIPSVHACSCILRSFVQKYQDSDNVSTVKVLGQAKLDDKGKFVAWVKSGEEDKGDGYDEYNIYYRVAVKKTYKAPCRGRKQYLWLKTSKTSCGARLETGKWYLMGLTKDAEHPNWIWDTSLCDLLVQVKALTQSNRDYIKTHTTVCPPRG